VAIRTAWLKQAAEDLHITNPPKVALVRYVTSDKEMESMRRSCMAEQGWPLSPGGAAVVPNGQMGAYNLAAYTCMAKYEFNPAMARPWTQEQQDIVYDYWVNTEIPCIQKHGYTVTGLPSRDVFHAKYNLNDWGGWAPLGNVSPDPGRDGDKLQEDCPETPPFNVLYGTGGK